MFFGAFGGPGGQPGGLYEIPAGGSPALVTSQFGAWTSVAVDGNGDVWGAGSAADLVMVPHGSTVGEVVTMPGEGYIDSVRFDASNDLYAATGFGDVAAELPVGSSTTQTFGTSLGFTQGIAVNGAGDIFVGSPSGATGFGKVYEIVPGVSQSVYAQGQIAETGGLAIWPPQVPGVRATSSTVLTTTSPSAVNTETPVTVTATVSPSSSGGPVQFDDNGQALGGLVTPTGGVAQLTTTLPAGSHSVTATYLGDAAGAPSVSNALAFTVTAVSSKTVLSAPDGTTFPGDGQATAEATVTGHGGTPTGTVTFLVNGNAATTVNLDSTGHAIGSFPLPPGSSKITASYSGDSTFAASTSNRLTFTTTTPYLPSVRGSVTYGPPNSQLAVKATIHVTVAGVRGEGAPTGTVTANDHFTCSALTPGATGLNSTAKCTHVVPNNTFETVTVSYGGNSVYTSASTGVSVSTGG